MYKNNDQKTAVELANIHTSNDNTNPSIPTPSIPTKDGYRLNPDHYQEWLSSCVDGELIQANNIRSVEGDGVYDYLLGCTEADRRNDGRLTNQELKRYDHCRDGGWWFYSVSVRDGSTTEYGCFKPDNPRENAENGQPIKYEAPKGSKPQLLAFEITPKIWKMISDRYRVPIGLYTNFYIWLKDHPEIPLAITEGAKKVGCLLSMGFAAIGVSGVTHCYKTVDQIKQLHPDIEYLCNGSRHIYFFFDCDPSNKTRKTVHSIIRKTAGLIKEYNANCRIFKVTWNGAKGVDDYVNFNGTDRLETQVRRAKPVSPIAPDYENNPANSSNRKSGETAQKLTHIRRSYPSLRFNELTQRVELNGQPFQRLELAYLDEAIQDSPIHIGKEFCQDGILKVALENSYHPVKEYLEHLEADPLSQQEWDNISGLLLGTDDPLSNAILKRCLIACVARIYDPGCISRLVTILTGKQRAGKSTFWRYLAGNEFFSDSLGSLQNIKDDYLTLHSSWIMEWGEFDKVTRKREADEIKAFVTKCFDDFRPPYGRSTERFNRMQVIVGTTNRADFLKNDPSGNTRYGVIEVKGDINLDLVLALRDRIWATAKQAYINGEPWELTRAEQELSESNNRNYEEQHPWMEAITKYIEPKETVTTNEILSKCLEIDLSRRTVIENRIVSDLLRKLGWTQDKNPSKTEYGRCRVWRHTDTLMENSVCRSVCQVESAINQDLQEIRHTDTLDNQQKKEVCKSSSTNESPINTSCVNESPTNENLINTSSVNKEADGELSGVQPDHPHQSLVVVNLDAPSNKEISVSSVSSEGGHTDETLATPEIQPDTLTGTLTDTLTSVSSVSNESNDSIDYQELIASIDAEMSRLGWTKERGIGYIQGKYGVKSRVQLSDAQIIEFFNYLRGELKN